MSDKQELNTSYIGVRHDLLCLIDHDALAILDVGCATGANGKYLLDNERVEQMYGIEFDEKMASLARMSYSLVVVGDVETMDLASFFGGTRFDYILLGDILEHLKDPWTLMQEMTNLLMPDGKIILSVPNIQHIDVFIHIFLRGIFPRNERGIFDKTHLRFFTHKSLMELLDITSLKVIQLRRNFRYRDRLNSKFPFYGKILKVCFKNYYTFQFVVSCQKVKN